MTRPMVRASLLVLLMAALPCPALAADLSHQGLSTGDAEPTHSASAPLKISGRTSVIDGRTLWFPAGGNKIRLASLDTCELPQWSYDPRMRGESEIPKPVPCGPLAKAWLKRTVGSAQVTCIVRAADSDGALVGRCSVRGRDLALEMLRVGWAKTVPPVPAEYAAWQRHAMSARHGMWATYVLDMPEWRAKAVDRTPSRRPIADFNLLAEREREISPPFGDARRRPQRTDR
ncbi:MAG: thermonuclease family protein [Pseudomonadota bacterium]